MAGEPMVAVQFTSHQAPRPAARKPAVATKLAASQPPKLATRKAPAKPATTFKHPPATQAALAESKQLKSERRELRAELATEENRLKSLLGPGMGAFAASLKLMK
jgi:hypothetical protein